MNIQIKIIGACKSYDSMTSYVLKNFNYIFEPGQIYTVFGPSGSGKTTLLNIIMGLTKLDSGETLYNDVPLNGKAMQRFRLQHMGVIFQENFLLNNITGRENMFLHAAQVGLDEHRFMENFEAISQALDISHLTDQPVKRLSMGERQRVAIGRALINWPSIILADEPTASLDLANAERVVKLFKSLSTEGALVIIATHDSFFQAEGVLLELTGKRSHLG